MKIIFMGTPEFSVPILQALADAGHEILCVYTQPPRPAGRGKKERPGPVHQLALSLGLPVRHPTSLKLTGEHNAFAELKADIAVVVAYGLILPQAILDAPTQGCVNIHASLLPRWRGAAPIHRAIMAGDEMAGVCIMQMDAGLDTGDVLLQRELAISPYETTGSLHDRLSKLGADTVVDALADTRALVRVPQPAIGVTYAEKIDKSEARIDWSKTAPEVDRKIRGLSPFPGAWCMAGDERIKLTQSRVASGDGEPGQVLDGLVIACGTGAVEIVSAQRQGKRAMDADEFLRGFDLPDRLD